MDLDAGPLLAGFLVSSVGFVLFSYGRKLQRVPQTAVGLVLLVLPLLSPGAVVTLGAGAALAVALWVAIRAGY